MYTQVTETQNDLGTFQAVIQHMGKTVMIDGRALILLAIDYANDCFIAVEKDRNFKTLVRFEEVA
jgi:hypothetical protein